MEKFEVICLVCPLACNITLSVQKGKVIDVTGFKCNKGEEYALQEYISPQRILTSTVKTTDKSKPLLPVITTVPISKKLLIPCMKILAQEEIHPPVKIGQVIVKNIMTGVDVIATRNLSC